MRSDWHVRRGDPGLLPRLVVDAEFLGGPLAGRRITALGDIRILHFYGFDADGRPRLATSRTDGVPLGSYRYERSYDCERTLEQVIVLAWVSCRATPAGEAQRAPPTARSELNAPRHDPDFAGRDGRGTTRRRAT